jgi:tetratricopeptide (TPR) repeat protein
MKKMNNYFWIFFLLATFSISGLGISYSEEPDKIKKEDIGNAGSKEKQKELYEKALVLRDEGDYDAAIENFQRLKIENPNVSEYEMGYLDTLIEQSLALKESNNPGWRTKVREIGGKIKSLYNTYSTNADYYLVYAKYSYLVEAKRQSHIFKALEKAFYYKPHYTSGLIVKGDIYFGLAKNAEPSDQMEVKSVGMEPIDSRQSLGMTAKTSYKSALSATDLPNRKQAYIYYKMGDLENEIFGNREAAKAAWEKAVSLSPDSRAGKIASIRLKQ